MSPRARALPYLLILLAPLGYALGCGNGGGTDGTGGAAPGTGGGTPGTGGGPSTGGANPGTGGAPGDGGGPSTGGANPGTGGAPGDGGGTSTGGGDGTGGGGNPTGGIVPGTDNYDCSEPSGTVPALQLVEITDGLDNPIQIAYPPNDLERVFVLEQDGSIAVVENGTLVEERFLEFQEKVYSEADGAFNEQGFLGFAFHPDYAENGLFYVHYSAQANGTDDPGDADGDTIISEYHVSDDPNVADAASERIVLTVEQPAVNHNGGTIAFGSDGFLYIGLGDGGNSNDNPQMEGQDPSGVLGSILRIDPLEAGGEPYSSPAGNLIDVVGTAAPEVWDYGVRNPYRFNFDGCTGALYMGDVGQDAWEEINVELAGEGHKNYGWPIMEGTNCRGGGSCDQNGLTLPIAEYDNPSGQGTSRAVVGGTVYRGADIPALRGAYFYLDAYTGQTWHLFYDEASGEVTGPTDVTTDLNPAEEQLFIAAIQNGADGELIFVSRQQGALLQLATE